MPTPKRKDVDDLRGVLRLAFDAATGVTDVVESIHRTVQDVPLPVSPYRPGRTEGISGLVYRAVRGGMRVVGTAVDTSMGGLSGITGERETTVAREAIVSAVNGLYGDYLAATANELAISMELRARDGLHLETILETVDPREKVVVFIHGLCMSDRMLRRNEHDHALALARARGYTPVYLWYNTGLPVAVNGRELATLLERTLASWPVPITELDMIGYSMGGLVARSACYYGQLASLEWPARLRTLITLGTPHRGAPLAKLGHWAEEVIELSPYAAPISNLSRRRSAGLHDLRDGAVVDDARVVVPLPEHVICCAVAGSLTGHEAPVGAMGQVGATAGDGLVSVDSALGRAEATDEQLTFRDEHRYVARGANHLALLDREDVFAKVLEWLDA